MEVRTMKRNLISLTYSGEERILVGGNEFAT